MLLEAYNRFACWIEVRMIRTLLTLTLIALASPAPGQALSVEEFFKRPLYSQPSLSPDGRRLAVIVPADGRDHLGMLDVDLRKGGRITKFANADVLRFFWVNSSRLLFAVGEAHEASGDAQFFGWYAVNADGTELRPIDAPETHATNTSRRAPGERNRLRGFRYLAPDPGDRDAIIVEARLRSPKMLDVYRYHTKNGEMTLLSFDQPTNVTRWLVDRAGVPRVARSYYEGIATIWYRAADGQPWLKLDEAEDSKLKIQPLAFDYDNRTLYVASPALDDKAAIYRYDFERRQLGERLARHLDVDLNAMLFSRSKHALLGIAFDADKPGTVWFNEEMARLQATVDKALPNTINQLRVADENPRRALVAAFSDTHPTDYYLFDVGQRALEKIAVTRPWINPGDMSARNFVRYKARDGLEIPAYLTLPKHAAGKKPPLVVEIHGGPWVPKQSWGFNPTAQFFASRGYAVLQPDFRGTLGYGRRHYTASFGQWGLAMQDDITDGVEWLVREGVVDGNNVCLFGGSYGGYATLSGLTNNPELYRCGVAYVAATDIGLLFDIAWSDWARSPTEWLEYGARTRIGDPERDRAKFDRVSPLNNAGHLKAPVLLAYGGADRRVPLKHGTAFRDALDRSGKRYEWVVYGDEGHGFNKDENRFDFFRRVESFLKQHLN